jgi:hypothetical protein
MLSYSGALTPELVEKAYDAAFASNSIYDQLICAENDLRRTTLQAKLYGSVEGEIVYMQEIADLNARVEIARHMFSLLCDTAGIVMAPRSYLLIL